MSDQDACAEGRITNAYWTSTNHAYTCLRCGRQYARLLLGENWAKRFWTCHTGYCEKCPSPWPNDIPGSVADEIEARVNDGHGCAHLSGELLLREFHLHAGVDGGTQCVHTTATVPNAGTSKMTPLSEQIAALRAKIISHAPVTDEELREAIKAMRGNRAAASERRDEKKAATAKPKVDVGSLLAKLQAAGGK